MEKEYVDLKIGDLIPYPRNVRTHSEGQIGQIRDSLREFGFINPVIVDEKSRVIAGHGRLEAARREKMETVPCLVVSGLTDEQRKAYIIADNKIGDNSAFDDHLLALEVADLDAADFDVNLLGFGEHQLSQLLDSVATEPIEDALKENPGQTNITQRGDLWYLGCHKILCADSENEESFTKLLGSSMCNLVFTDPPYNVNYSGEAGMIKGDNMSTGYYLEFLTNMFRNVHNVMDRESSIYSFYGDNETQNVFKAFDLAGFRFAERLVWVKNHFVLGRLAYHHKHESIFYGWKKDGKNAWYGDRKQTTVWEFEHPSHSAAHPTMKPVALVAYAIKNSTKKGQLVLDPFLGSGTTIIAAEQTGRICYGIEWEPRFVDTTLERWINHRGSSEGVILLRDGKKMAYDDLR